jgi:hypothetical protein
MEREKMIGVLGSIDKLTEHIKKAFERQCYNSIDMLIWNPKHQKKVGDNGITYKARVSHNVDLNRKILKMNHRLKMQMKGVQPDAMLQKRISTQPNGKMSLISGTNPIYYSS